MPAPKTLLSLASSSGWFSGSTLSSIRFLDSIYIFIHTIHNSVTTARSHIERLWFLVARLGVALLLFLVLGAAAVAQDATPSGPPRVHDPSTILKCNGEYWLFATGPGIVSRHSRDLLTWEAGPRVFTNPPAWTTNAVPGNRGYFWAPDLVYLDGRYLLYYSVSTWGSQTSAIGLATSPTLDPAAPNYHWMDEGMVLQSSPHENFNAIDPGVMLAHDGELWLVLGSYWSGIKLVALDPRTGKRLDTNAAPIALAWKEAIEAPCLVQHADSFYLFVNWGQCCRGTNSTYNIRVGRSQTATGPFLDKAGRDMLQGGGSLVLESKGRFIGPGHAGVLAEGTTNWLSFHFYDGARYGAPTLSLRRLRWNGEGWPEVDSATKTEW